MYSTLGTAQPAAKPSVRSEFQALATAVLRAATFSTPWSATSEDTGMEVEAEVNPGEVASTTISLADVNPTLVRWPPSRSTSATGSNSPALRLRLSETPSTSGSLTTTQSPAATSPGERWATTSSRHRQGFRTTGL